MSHRRRKQSRRGTDTEGVIGSNGDGNSKIRYLIQIVSFSIKDITDYSYFMQLRTEMMKLMKNLLGLQ